MARTAYDVNRTVRHLDIHKQFMGGLKTVDTDDALRTVYLRELKNLSLSEFGFIEKRYGIYKSEEFQFVNTNGDAINPFNISGKAGLIQGYFEYVDKSKRVHKLIFIDGVAYVKDPRPGSAYPDKYRAIDLYYQEPGKDYPSQEEIELGTGFEGITDTSKIISVNLPVLYDLIYRAKDLSQPAFNFNFIPQINFNATDIQDQTLSTTITINSFIGDFFQAVSQEDIQRGYEVNVSPNILTSGIKQEDVLGAYSITENVNFDYADLGQIDIIRAYSYDILSNFAFAGEKYENQEETDAFNLNFGLNVSYQGSDNTTVNDPIVSVSSVTSNSAQLNVSNQNNPFEVIAKYSLVSSQPNLSDPGFTVPASSTDSTVITGLNSEQNYTVAVRLYRSADTSYFSDPDSASFTTCAAAGTYLGYSCSGTTRINSYADGNCGTYTTTESNSTACGYVPPLTTPNYEGANIGENSIAAQYYNPNNTSATLRVTVSRNGNFVDQSNVPIGAQSNTSVSFGQLSPDTSYTFTAYLTASGYQDSSTRVNTITTDPEPCDPYGTYLGYYCSGTTRIDEYADGNCGVYTTSTANSTSCGYVPPPTPDQTESPTVNLSSPSGGLNIFIQNNDSSTVSLSYSGTATQYFNLPSTLGPGSTFSDSTSIFPGTYNICVTATASGEDPSDQVCDTQTV